VRNLLIIIALLLAGLNGFGQVEKIDTTILEGIYTVGFESSTFDEIGQENHSHPSWLSFSDSIEIDSLFDLRLELATRRDGVYLKFFGIKKQGESYGHLGGAKSEVIILKLMEVDSSRTLQELIKELK
jgi:hypothetical protein